MAQYSPAKRRRISPPGSDASASELDSTFDQFTRNVAKWDLEQDYEQRPRKVKSRESTRLPIKTANGWIKQHVPEEVEEDQLDSFPASDEDELPDAEEGIEEEEQPKVSQRQQILEAKEELARLAGLINENPEENVGSLRAMAQLAGSPNIPIRKLALAAQGQVYKDIIPSYRIRPRGEDESKEKISKEVRKLRNYEQSMVKAYQNYIKELEKISRTLATNGNGEPSGLASVAISCACNLLLAVPHFNFRGDLVKIVVSKIGGSSLDEDFNKCVQTLQELFENDDDGHSSTDAVSQITKMAKAKDYRIREEVLNTFLHLRLLSEFSAKGSQHSIDRDGSALGNRKGKRPKEKRQFRTKNERKMMRENKAIEKEMREADAAVGHEERDKMQAEMLKMVFATYFRVLKAQTSHLMGAVLEGLAKYSHLINQDFFGDILEALKDLINVRTVSEGDDLEDGADSPPRDATRESLLCTITAFALLQGQDASSAANTLHLDLNFFITHLYRTLYPVCMNADIEFNSNSQHLPDPSTTNTKATAKVNIQTTTVLLLRSLSSTLLPAAALRAIPPTRIAAFTKALMTASLQLPEKSCVAMLELLQQVAKVHGRKVKALWFTEERRGDGVFEPLREEVEGCNPFASTIWEGELLRVHYAPGVRRGVKGINKTILDA